MNIQLGNPNDTKNEISEGCIMQNHSDNQGCLADLHSEQTSPLDLTLQKMMTNTFSAHSRLNFEFFNRPCIDLAKSLLGQILVRKLKTGETLKGAIVETESYLGKEDKSSHSYNGKQTERNQAMFMDPGTAYVYSIYGMYYCFNISSLGEGAAVLIRSLEPILGFEHMKYLRGARRQDKGSKLKERELCNGPSKLCQAMNIEKEELNKKSLVLSTLLWLEEGTSVQEKDIVKCKRIGIESAGEEWANKPLRFYIKNNKFVSVRNRIVEAATI